MKIKDIVDINNISINKNYQYNEIEYLDTSSVTEGKIEKIQILNLNEAPSRAKRIVRKNDILISTVRPILRHFAIIKKPKENTIASTGFAVISCKNVYPYYLYCYLTTNWYTDYLSSIAESQQSNYPAFNPSLIENTDISLPPLPIQKKIAAVLSAYDDLIESNNRRIAILEKMAEEIYREWFVRMRFPGHEKVKFHKGVPEGWELTKIENLCDEKRIGIKLKDVQYNTKYIGLEHLPRKSIAIKDSDTVESIQSNKLLFKDRDILFCKIRPYLHKVALAHFAGACSTDTIVIRPKKVEYEGLILFTVFSTTFIELATASAKGTKMPRADWDFLKKLEILLPGKNILATFQTQFDSYFALICNYLNANERLKQSRDLLLSRLLSGKLSVENLDIKFPPGMEETDA